MEAWSFAANEGHPAALNPGMRSPVLRRCDVL
jgi:hypothetical protein